MSRTSRKKSLTVALPLDLIEYLEKKVESREFSSMAHGVELALLRFKQTEEQR